MIAEYWLIGIGVLSILFAIFLAYDLKKYSRGTKEMIEISDIIKSGAKSYLTKQYKILTIVAVIIAVLLSIFINIQTGIAFLFGSFLSGSAGIIGMMIATSSNARTTEGCRKSLYEGFKIAFSSGVITGIIIVSLGLLGVIISFLVFSDFNALFGFGFGASLIALFARVGGGIYTKAADVGADLVGKVELGIPEDDPRNPAVIADNVGDNVGDVAGMGADLFESYVQSIIATMALGLVFLGSMGMKGAIFPLLIAALGIIASIIGSSFVKIKTTNPRKALNRGIFVSSILVVIFSYFAVKLFLGEGYINIFYSIFTGLAAGVVIGLSSEYYTSNKRRPVISIAKASQTGAATNIIQGLSVGMMSTVIPIFVIVIAIILSYDLAGLFGIAIASVGMLSTLGMTLATETYAPVADNAAGIAEMTHLKGPARKRAEELDAVGNTTAALGKGFDVGCAALTALALFAVFGQEASLTVIDVLNTRVLGGLFIGALLPFVFCSLTMKSVGKTAFTMVNEIRRQFKQNKNLLKGKGKPDYNKPIEIATEAALKEMILPGVIAMISPLIIGILFGIPALGGLLVGTTVTGLIFAIMLTNTGGAWDNAKKYIEAGNLGGVGSDAHKAAVIGDTVGDPAKDTSGPSLNILIKIVSIVALLYVSVAV